jgi:hypothetical protein
MRDKVYHDGQSALKYGVPEPTTISRTKSNHITIVCFGFTPQMTERASDLEMGSFL